MYVQAQLEDGNILSAEDALRLKSILDSNADSIISLVLEMPTVESMAFYSLPKLKEIIIKGNIKIESYGFGNCPNLEQVTIGKNIGVTFAKTSFLGCTSLKRIIGNPTQIRIK